MQFKDETETNVKINKNFKIQVNLFTQAQWYSVVGSNHSRFRRKNYCESEYLIKNRIEQCPSYPVENISWNEVQFAIEIINKHQKKYHYRLPTEEEWEVSARGGMKTIYWFGDAPTILDKTSYYEDNSNNQTHPTGLKLSNPFGLKDMGGMVWQMTSSDFTSHELSPTLHFKTLKSGSWTGSARIVRPAIRFWIDQEQSFSNVGFRLASDF